MLFTQSQQAARNNLLLMGKVFYSGVRLTPDIQPRLFPLLIGPTGAAMPLCWSHAEYISLVRSRHDGVCFDRIEPAFKRYVVNRVDHLHEMWSFRHAIQRIPQGKMLRLIVAAEANVTWSVDGWITTQNTASAGIAALKLWFADLTTKDSSKGAVIEFTFFWREAQRWEGRNYAVEID